MEACRSASRRRPWIDWRGRGGGGRGGPAARPLKGGRAGPRLRLAETSEARAILDADGLPPLDGVRDQTRVLGRLRKGGILTGEELRGLRPPLGAIRETSRFLLC